MGQGQRGETSLDLDHLQYVRAARAGDQEAFTRLVHAYKDQVFRTAWVIVQDHAEAEDVVQEAFVKAYLSLRTLRDDRASPEWLSKMTTRHALDAVCKRRTYTNTILHEVYITCPNG
jgi:RNA polymerase sigma-70 factor (ECF subfamily)